MSGFPRDDYRPLKIYDVARPPVALDLSDNTNLWGAHPAAVEAISTADGPTLTRYPTPYSDPLRAQVAKKFGVTPDCVTTGCGSDDVLDSLFRAACRPPGLLSYAAPTFVMAEVTARMNGLDTRAVGWRAALDEPDLLLEGDPDLVYLCTPNNPSGAALEPEWVENFLARVGPEGPLVVLDEAYADFHGPTNVALALEHGRTFVARTLSKLYALAGMRVGYGIAVPNLIREVDKSRGPFKLGGLAERAAVAALADDSGWTDRVVASMRENRERLVAELGKRGMQPHPSVTNFLLVPVSPLSTAMAVRELAARGILVRAFPDQPEQGDSVRITVGPWPMMETLLTALDEVMSA